MADPGPHLSALVDPPLADPPPLPELKRRAHRIRRRRWVARVSGGVALAVLLVVGVIALLPSEPGQTVRAAAPGGTSGTGIAPATGAVPGGGPVLLEQFDAAGRHWSLTVTSMAPGELCLQLLAGGSATAEAVGCWTPPHEPVNGLLKTDGPFRFVSGIVAKDVTTLALQPAGSGGRAEVLGRDAGFPVNFFSAVLPDGTDAVEVAAGTDAEPRRHVVTIPAHGRVSSVNGGPPQSVPTTVAARPPVTGAATPASTTSPSTTVPPDGPVGTVVPPTTIGSGPPVGGQPARVEVVPGATGLHKGRFESAAASGASSVAVRFWGGVAPCDVLGRVDVVEAADRVTITLWSGTAPGAENTACIAIAQYKETIVTLPAPLAGRALLDGAA